MDKKSLGARRGVTPEIVSTWNVEAEDSRIQDDQLCKILFEKVYKSKCREEWERKNWAQVAFREVMY